MAIPVVPDYEHAFAQAIAAFWTIKGSQQAAADLLGTSAGATHGAVRAGKHMAPFEVLVRQVVADAGVVVDPVPSDTVYLPGYYRETKSWDVVLQYLDGMSYAQRYAMAFKRLDQERMLDATCVAITNQSGAYSYPDALLSFNGFAAQLWGRCKHALAVLG